jgi:hypothetical protein
MAEGQKIPGSVPANGEFKLSAAQLIELNERGGIGANGTVNPAILQEVVAATSTKLYDPLGLFSEQPVPAQTAAPAPAAPASFTPYEGAWITPAPGEPSPVPQPATANAAVTSAPVVTSTQAGAPEDFGIDLSRPAGQQGGINFSAMPSPYAPIGAASLLDPAKGLGQPFNNPAPKAAYDLLASAPAPSSTASTPETPNMAEPSNPQPAAAPTPAPAPAPAPAAAPAPAEQPKFEHGKDFKFDETNPEHVKGVKTILNEYFGAKREMLDLNTGWDDKAKEAMKQAKIEQYADSSLNVGYLKNTLGIPEAELKKHKVLGEDGNVHPEYKREAPSEEVVKAAQAKLGVEQTGKYDDALKTKIHEDKKARYIDGSVTGPALDDVEKATAATREAAVKQEADAKKAAETAAAEEEKKKPGFFGNNKGGLLMGALAMGVMFFTGGGGGSIMMMLLAGLAAFAGGNLLMDKDNSVISGLLGNAPQAKADFEQGLKEGKGVDGVFKALDKNNDGKITIDDNLKMPDSAEKLLDEKTIAQVTSKNKEGLSQEDFKKLLANNENFRKAITDWADKNNDGKIARAEINSLGDAPPAPPASTPAPPAPAQNPPSPGR